MVERGYVFGQVGKKFCRSGGVHKFGIFAGSFHAACGKKRGSFDPSKRRDPGRPTNILEKTKAVCVLGMGYERLASAL